MAQVDAIRRYKWKSYLYKEYITATKLSDSVLKVLDTTEPVETYYRQVYHSHQHLAITYQKYER
jgi:hypothetical protein